MLASLCLAAAPAYARDRAPGAPGDAADWTAADKHGFGTSTTRASKVWFTLRARELTEVYYPDLGTPAVRDLEFVVGDQGESAGTGKVERLAGSLTFRQTVATSRWRLTKTYVTDPARAVVLVRVKLESLDGKAHRLALRLDPALSNDGDDDVAWTRGHVLLAHDVHAASALVARPAFTKTSSGYAGHENDLLAKNYDALRPGNVVQAARTRLTGLTGHQDLTLALAFGKRATLALRAAQASLKSGFDAVAAGYALAWAAYRARLNPAPASAAPILGEYETSLLMLKADEDKTHPGAFVASPSMPWGYGRLTIDENAPSSLYHVVRARDEYAIATAEISAGDKALAGRALDFMLGKQLGDDGTMPASTEVDGTAVDTTVELDQAALPILLAWQLGRFDSKTWRRVRAAADAIVKSGPASADRWGGEEGYSPGTIAAEVAALVCASDLAVRNGDGTRASTYTRMADEWAANVEKWTATSNGPYAPKPYYLRLTTDRRPDSGTTYAIGDSGPGAIDQRKVVDPSFLELVRLGIKAPGDPAIVNSLAVADAQLGGHRYTDDGYGEQRDGGPWQLYSDGARRTLGRLWPVLSGERGEYELAAGRPATAQLAAMAAAANDGGMLPEQVWDAREPSSKAGGGTRSATPLAWTHAQLVRLAWSAAAGRPVERPGIVACHFMGLC